MLVMIAALMLATGDQAPDGTRSIDYELRTTAPLIEVQTCLTRRISTSNDVIAVPLEGGIALDVSNTPLLFAPRGKAWLSIEIREKMGARSITLRYRHPFSAKTVVQMFTKTAKACIPELQVG